MQYNRLGNSGIMVSKMCFGGLIIGPLQANMSIDEGAKVILKALELGVNFIDTAEFYGTYAHIREAVKRWGRMPVIATKSYAYTAEGARDSLEQARKSLDTDVIDIFLLHEQESRLTLRGHRDALDYYLAEKAKGRIRAVGISTHNIEVVDACCNMPEIDIIHPIVNLTGVGIGDGTIDEMLCAIRRASECGKGIYSMKPLGGGNLLKSYDDCMRFVLDIPFINSIAVGMQSAEEVIMNVCTFEGREVSCEIRDLLSKKDRRLHIDYWCQVCGNCVMRCQREALSISEGRLLVNNEKCVLCGYCSSVCPQFAIKIC
jgi:uncharacterized protein